MTLTTEQQRWLTEEFLGLCWHETYWDYACSDEQPRCTKCKKSLTIGVRHHLDFTDWRTFGLLMNELVKTKTINAYCMNFSHAKISVPLDKSGPLQ